MTLTDTVTAPQLEKLVNPGEGPKVVALGGGHGLAVTLKAVQSYATQITAIVAVADDGGSSGRLTSGLGIPPPGDIRRCLLALTPESNLWSDLFGYRFPAGDIEDHSLGNLLLAALTDITGDFIAAVDAAAKMLNAVGRVVPAATEPAVLRAIVNGTEVVGQAAITNSQRIETMALGPEGIAANPAALRAITEADQIILGPGSLFTSLMAVCLVPGITEAWEATNARKVFVLNLIEQDGETLGLSGAEHLRSLAAIAGIGGPGVVVVHQGELLPAHGLQTVTVDPDTALAWGWDVLSDDVVDHVADWPEHHPESLGKVLARLAGT
jgi:uncharacterized cofD-like protein